MQGSNYPAVSSSGKKSHAHAVQVMQVDEEAATDGTADGSAGGITDGAATQPNAPLTADGPNTVGHGEAPRWRVALSTKARRTTNPIRAIVDTIMQQKRDVPW